MIRLPRGHAVAKALVQLAEHCPHLGEGRVLRQPLLEKGQLGVGVAKLAFDNCALHPHARCRLPLACFLQDDTRALGLAVLELELERRQPDGLAFWVGYECFLQDLAGRGYIPGQPLLLGTHEPQHLRLRAVGDSSPQQRIEALALALGLLELGGAQPDALFAREDCDGVRIDGASGLDATAFDTLLGVSHPSALHVLLLDADGGDGAHDGAAGRRAACALCGLRFLHPRLALNDDAVALQRAHPTPNDLVRHRGVAICLLKLARGEPYGRFGWDRLARLVQDLLGIAVRLQTHKRQPELDVLRAALNCAAEHDASVLFTL
mmetsp:Transcript_900/g.3522  ORF Transcript_900/g.3522 Transcript_900/m.3522 type:complete len:321 (+) Transcript_900:684-1646(+)